jgi:tetratricopeptide (TPR) repeat protein
VGKWAAFPHTGEFAAIDAAHVRANWARLHAGDAEPLPQGEAVLQAWTLFHRGEFQKAAEAGLAAGGAGVTVANKATCIYATYLEKKEKARLELFQEVARRAEQQAAREPKNAAAWHHHGYALGRYSQAISVAKALAQGLGGRVKESLEKAIRLNPRHADAHIALGAFHAEVIDKVGPLIGGLTYGARKETGLQLFREALRLNPNSPIALIEYANALVMLEGESHMAHATALYEQAAGMAPADATQRLDVALALAELQE